MDIRNEPFQQGAKDLLWIVTEDFLPECFMDNISYPAKHKGDSVDF